MKWSGADRDFPSSCVWMRFRVRAIEFTYKIPHQIRDHEESFTAKPNIIIILPLWYLKMQ